MPFNRTIVELKRRITARAACEILTFNRTIVELKHFLTCKCGKVANAFNRTIVELKPASAVILSKSSLLLLIEPLWN